MHPPRVGVHPVGRRRASRAAAGRWCPPRPGSRRITTGPLNFSFTPSASARRLQPGAQHPLAALDLLDRHVLLLLVGQHRVAGPEVDRRYAERGEPRDVGPAELRVDRRRRRPRRTPWRPGGRGRAGRRRRMSVTVTSYPVEEVADERLGLRLAAVGGEAEVDLDDALVGDHVAGDAAADADGVEALVVGQAVDHRLAGDVVVEPGQDRRGPVDRVDALPAAGAVGPLAVVRTSTRMVPWQPASTAALLGSIRIAKSAPSRSGSLSVSLRRPLRPSRPPRPRRG